MATSKGGPVGELVVVGHVNVDRFLHVDQFPAPDRTMPIRSARIVLGGTATNIARTAAAYGVGSALIARIGDDFPVEFTAQLARERVDLTGVETVAGARSPTCFIVVDQNGGQRTLIDQGPMENANGARIPRETLGTYRWVHLATGDPEYQLRVKVAARALGLRVSVDPAQEVFYRWDRRRMVQLLDGSEILFGNRPEIEEVARLVGASNRSELLARVPMIIETRGVKGVVAYTRSGDIRVPALPVRRPVTQVGAGDAFRGGFYAGWFAGQPIDRCLTAGIRAAAAWVRSGGPPRPAPRRRADPP